MSRGIHFIALMILFFPGIVGCEKEQSPIESISIDFPHGETRLLVTSNGEAFLYYGALPSYQKVRSGTFDIEILYKQLETRLHDNVPREEWSNPGATAGMAIIAFKDQSEKTYLIFDRHFAEQLFKKGRENIIDKVGQKMGE
jgi:hypothetical protein